MFNLILEGNLLLVGRTRPDAGEIGVDAVFMAAQQIKHRLSGDLADSVPNRVFDAAPSPQTIAQLALNIEQVLAYERFLTEGRERARIRTGKRISGDAGVGDQLHDRVAMLHARRVFGRGHGNVHGEHVDDR